MRKRWIRITMAVCMFCALYLLSREGALMVSKKAEESKGVIVIDSGHGGIDPGVVGIDSLKEKDINLKIAKYLAGYLEKEGYETVLTRETDKGLYDENSSNKKIQDMQNRCALIKEKEPLLTVSIHQNSYGDESVCGPQVFYYTDSKQGKELAGFIQEELNTQLKVLRPRTEKANSTYYLLKKSQGILNIVETGFLTNQREAELLKTKDYQKKCARAICDGILNFLKTVEKEAVNVL